LGTLDVFTIIEENDIAYINYLAVQHGSVIHTKTIEIEKKLAETAAEVLPYAIAYLRKQFNSKATEIIVPVNIQLPETEIKITIPRVGEKRKNCWTYRLKMSIILSQLYNKEKYYT
jgi:excinuclease ABC subunit C